ncbi:hypothetical protein [Pectobacterium brasiliense]|uniref:hypothetical protein n=1 Tax=Pectobacterium brasiliense TaxID=180957 RepID=UPI001968B8BC|nr:hypothetical protein [Pectobacterium brasiliense]MBN3262243.1 hypothetical protein [Pectobacterium brasiliense]
MYKKSEKTQENKNRSIANSFVKNKSDVKQCFGFVDNRCGSVFQRKTKEIIKNNTQVAQPTQLQEKNLSSYNSLSSKSIIQLAVDHAIVKATCERLKISCEGNKIIEVPDKVMANTKFKDYPEGYVIGLSEEEKNESLTSIQLGPGQESEYADATAKLLLSLLGGAAYNHKIGAVVITEKMVNYERNLLHEMGHHKQNIVSGFNSDNTTAMLLEYHNVLCNENLFDGPKRISYGDDQTQFWVTKWNKIKDKEEQIEFIEGKAKELIRLEEEFYQKLLTSKNKKEKDLDVYGLIAKKLSKVISIDHENPDDNFYVVRALYNMIKESISKIT